MLKRYVAAFTLAAFATFLTFVLITWGGIVHNTGSSLACPDWPLCYGQLIVDTTGKTEAEKTGIFWEHTHRHLATLIGICSIGLLGLLWRPHPARGSLRGHAAWLLGLILLQGVLGGITVLLQLSDIVSTVHLALSMIVFGYFLFLCLETWRGILPDPPAAPLATETPLLRAGRTLLIVTAVAVWLQMILGAAVRHTVSSTAAGIGLQAALVPIDPNTGSHAFWSSYGPAALNIFHRYVAIVIAALVVLAVGRVWALWRRLDRPVASALLWTPALLVLLQLVIGVAMLAVWGTDAGNARVVLRTLHLSVPALLLMNIWWLILLATERLPSVAVKRRQRTSRTAQAQPAPGA